MSVLASFRRLEIGVRKIQYERSAGVDLLHLDALDRPYTIDARYCDLSIDGEPCDGPWLFGWIRDRKLTEARIVIDMERTGLIVEADFRSGRS